LRTTKKATKVGISVLVMKLLARKESAYGARVLGEKTARV